MKLSLLPFYLYVQQLYNIYISTDDVGSTGFISSWKVHDAQNKLHAHIDIYVYISVCVW